MHVPAVEADAPPPALRRIGLLYSLMLLAAMSLIVFSMIGIATMTDMVPGPPATPSAASSTADRAPAQRRGIAESRDAAPAQKCADCDSGRR